MAYDCLADFIEELERAGELGRIKGGGDPERGITEITDRVSKSRGPDGKYGGPALFFERVKGSRIPLVINLLGSERRMCRALGVGTLEEMAERIAALIKPQGPGGGLGTVKGVP